MTVLRIPVETPCQMKITASVTKMCPVRDEVDRGTVTVHWTAVGMTIELHSLAEYLCSFATKHLTHEQFTAQVAADLDALVISTWETAGLCVECRASRPLPESK